MSQQHQEQQQQQLTQDDDWQLAKSPLRLPLLMLLTPMLLTAIGWWPFLLVSSVVPLMGMFALPTLLSVTVFIIYANAWLLYLALAQDGHKGSADIIPLLIYSPISAVRVAVTTFQLLRDFVSSGALTLFLDLQFRRAFILGGKDAKLIVKENISYADGRRLDVYFAAPHSAPSADGALSPVILYLGGGNWTWWSKKAGAQMALRFRRLGYVVVVPDLRQWPEVKTAGMVEDLRLALEWTGSRISGYGGDPHEIHVMAYGSGAHLTALTIIQDAVVCSRDHHFASNSPVSAKGHELEPRLDISYGIRRCEIWGSKTPLPRIAGVILIAGVYDIVKQLRAEQASGWDDISRLRRACGPSSQEILQSCPSHLLFGSKQILDPARLPPKWLLIAGGKDDQVAFSQSVLMRLLLVGVGVEDVSLKLYKDESHIGCLGSLLRETRYSPLFIHEIETFVDYQP